MRHGGVCSAVGECGGDGAEALLPGATARASTANGLCDLLGRRRVDTGRQEAQRGQADPEDDWFGAHSTVQSHSSLHITSQHITLQAYTPCRLRARAVRARGRVCMPGL